MCLFRVLLPLTAILLKLHDVNGANKPYKPDAAAIVYFSVPTRELADKLSHALISEKLVACVNLLPDITAVFPTNKNGIKAEVQTMLIAKTATSRVQEIVTFVRKNHPDSMPDIVATPIRTGNGLFLEWVLSVVPPIIKKSPASNSTKIKRTRKSQTKVNIARNVNKANNNQQMGEDRVQNFGDEPPPLNESEEKDVIYDSRDPNDGNDPNESHANSYP